MRYLLSLMLGMVSMNGVAQSQEANYDERRVPAYTLPDPLVMKNGRAVAAKADWPRRRAEILQLFESQVYGLRPSALPTMTVVKHAATTSVQGVDAKRKLVTLRLQRNGQTLELEMLMFLPQGAERVPIFVGLNFSGNHTVSHDPDVPITKNWVRNDKGLGYADNRATAESRGGKSSRWALKQILSRGYGLATIYYGDIDPDYHDEFQNGAHALYQDAAHTSSSWGSISAWAWGLSRAMDYLETDEDVDPQRVAVMGHSRLGKTSLWAGATDPRFALVVSNNSGCGGAALSRRAYGETVKRINTSFPHWFCENHRNYNDNEDACPVDQHMLIALIAPRPVLICSAEEDRWADPRGEFLSGKEADPVYRLLGTDGLAADKMPGLNRPVFSRIGYHVRPGKHDVKSEDWRVYLDFADKHMR